MDQQLNAEINYQVEYFRRVGYYQEKLNLLIKSVVDLDYFLKKLKIMFNKIDNGLQKC